MVADDLIRIAVSIVQVLLAAAGTINLVVVASSLLSIRQSASAIHAYTASLCGANFLYAMTLTMVATTQLNRGEWALGTQSCRLHYAVEATGMTHSFQSRLCAWLAEKPQRIQKNFP